MSTILQLVGFKVDKEFFGVPIDKVKEIVRVPDITVVPDTPDFLEGVINLRGRIVPVVDMRTRIGLPTMERVRTNRVL
ncbi:MAG: chemotaxis protein CheW, partial [Thermodesulfobacteriota bacterium]